MPKKIKGLNEMMDLWGGPLPEPVCSGWRREGVKEQSLSSHFQKNVPQSYKIGGFGYISLYAW